MMFAVITPALITGATADRLKFGGYALFIASGSLIVYAPVAHWVWDTGGMDVRLAARSTSQAARRSTSTPASPHSPSSPSSAPARGHGTEPMPPHNLPLTVLGTGILWFGWFGFNAGSALLADGIASQAMVNTHLAAASAMLGWLIVEKLKTGHATTLGPARVRSPDSSRSLRAPASSASSHR